MGGHQDTSGNDDQASVPQTAAEWLAAIEAGRVVSYGEDSDDVNRLEGASWEVACEVCLFVDGEDAVSIPCRISCRYQGDVWKVRDDHHGRPQIVAHEEAGSWKVSTGGVLYEALANGGNIIEDEFTIPATNQVEAEELARLLDRLVQNAYDSIEIEPIGIGPLDWGDVDDIEKVSKIVWDANTPEEARELAAEAGIVGEENLLKAEGIWFRDEWEHGTDAFEELFPTYGEGSRATDPNDFLGDEFRSIVDGELSAREVSDWWKDYGKRLHDVEEAIRDVGLVYDGDTDGDFETRVRQLEAWLSEHTVEPHLPFVTPPECQGQSLEYSYSLVNNRGRTFIIEREHDHGDGEIVHRLYEDGDPDGDFAPQNGAPKLGKFVSRVAVEKQTFPTPEELAAMKADRIRF